MNQQIQKLKKDRQKMHRKNINSDISVKYESQKANPKTLLYKNIDKPTITLEQALTYIQHLEQSNAALHQKIQSDKNTYIQIISKLERKIQVKNQLLDQCERQIGHIKKQYNIVERCQKHIQSVDIAIKENNQNCINDKSEFNSTKNKTNKVVHSKHTLLSKNSN